MDGDTYLMEYKTCDVRTRTHLFWRPVQKVTHISSGGKYIYSSTTLKYTFGVLEYFYLMVLYISTAVHLFTIEYTKSIKYNFKELWLFLTFKMSSSYKQFH